MLCCRQIYYTDTQISIFAIEYLRENEKFTKLVLASLRGAKTRLYAKKYRVQNLVTLFLLLKSTQDRLYTGPDTMASQLDKKKLALMYLVRT